MNNPQFLHDAWLVVTAMTTLTIGGVALYLIIMFRHSERRRFFWAIGLLLVSVSIEQLCAEIKNYYQAAPSTLDYDLLTLWLAGRIQEAIIGSLVLIYLVFGRNGDAHEGG